MLPPPPSPPTDPPPVVPSSGGMFEVSGISGGGIAVIVIGTVCVVAFVAAYTFGCSAIMTMQLTQHNPKVEIIKTKATTPQPTALQQCDLEEGRLLDVRSVLVAARSPAQPLETALESSLESALAREEAKVVTEAQRAMGERVELRVSRGE
eukprot:6626460-Prymnesium_polylepis.1